MGLSPVRGMLESGVPHLQTNAAISHGSSGGPLLDSRGAVVGVVVASHADGQSLNLAIPASEVTAFLKGPVNTREIWRGSGINAEEEDAYSSAWNASYNAERQGKKSEGEFWSYCRKVGRRATTRAMRGRCGPRRGRSRAKRQNGNTYSNSLSENSLQVRHGKTCKQQSRAQPHRNGFRQICGTTKTSSLQSSVSPRQYD